MGAGACVKKYSPCHRKNLELESMTNVKSIKCSYHFANICFHLLMAYKQLKHIISRPG